jgi:hypothetical protein
MAGFAAVVSAGCVQSERQLITDAKPLMGESFEAHFFENFVDGKASVARPDIWPDIWAEQFDSILSGHSGRSLGES